MKKENRKIAQQRRAEEKKRQVRKERFLLVCKIGIPLLALLILIGVCVADPFSKYQDTGTADTSTESDTGQDTGTESTGYLTDTSLTVADGDTVNIDYIGYVDGVAFNGGNTNGNGTALTIGSGSYIDDFEEQLIGSHPGDIVEVNVTFPEDYGNEELNGKDATFTVTVNGIYE